MMVRARQLEETSAEQTLTAMVAGVQLGQRRAAIEELVRQNTLLLKLIERQRSLMNGEERKAGRREGGGREEEYGFSAFISTGRWGTGGWGTGGWGTGGWGTGGWGTDGWGTDGWGTGGWGTGGCGTDGCGIISQRAKYTFLLMWILNTWISA